MMEVESQIEKNHHIAADIVTFIECATNDLQVFAVKLDLVLPSPSANW